MLIFWEVGMGWAKNVLLRTSTHTSCYAADWLKIPIQRQLHTQRDNTFKYFGSTCMLLSGAPASQAKSSTNLANFVLKEKTKLLHQALGTKK